MAGQAGNRRIVASRRLFHLPGALRVDGCHEVMNRAGKEHTVTPQAIVIQEQSFVVAPIQKNGGVTHGVTAALPILRLLRVAIPTAVVEL